MKSTHFDNSITAFSDSLAKSLGLDEKFELLEERFAKVESELKTLKMKNTEGWMSLRSASLILNKTPDAIRQRLKHKKKPMPEGVVWKQEGRGCEIDVHLGNFRKYK